MSLSCINELNTLSYAALTNARGIKAIMKLYNLDPFFENINVFTVKNEKKNVRIYICIPNSGLNFTATDEFKF